MAKYSRHYLSRDTRPLRKRQFSVVWIFLFVLIGLVFLSAALFYFGTPYGWGIKGADPKAADTISFLDCLYFSVITITTLGYGDYQPQSFGRLVAGAEVVFGLVITGCIISSIVSRQQSRHTERLVRGYINSEIQKFRDQLRPLLERFESVATGAIPVHLVGKIDAQNLLYNASGLMLSIARYFRHEFKNYEVINIHPKRAIGRLIGDVDLLLEAVYLHTQDKSKLTLAKEERKYVRQITESTLVLLDFTEFGLRDRSYSLQFSRMYSRIIDLRKRLGLKRTDKV